VRLVSLLFVGVAIVLVVSGIAVAQTDPDKLPGLTIDDVEATLQGDWTSSTTVKPYLGKSYLHDAASGKGQKWAKFTFRVPVAGDYHLLIAYTHGGNRAKKVPLRVTTVEGARTVFLDQTQRPALGTGFQPVGQFAFSDTSDTTVTIETAGTDQHVIVDGIRLLTADELAVATAEEQQPKVKVVKKDSSKKTAKPKPQPPEFVRRPAQGDFQKITAEKFNALLAKTGDGEPPLVEDVKFLRRVTLDLVGRRPTLEEYRAFLADDSSGRCEAAVERLLGSAEFGSNWANYWSDLIAARQAEPQLTYLNYKPFKAWLAEQFNAGTGWDEIVFRMLTAIGKVGDVPEGTFIGFHQGERNKLAGETTRAFLGLQIACAQCHDHPFVDMPQETFHGMAAFFARTRVKLPWNDSNGIQISSDEKGKHRMPGSKSEMAPSVYRGEKLDLGLEDLQRRKELAYWVVSADNPYFAKSFVNHVQARLMGRGFYWPVDNQGEGATRLNPQAHEALAGHFIASDFDVKSVFRLLVSTRVYRRAAGQEPRFGADFSGAAPKKLRGDEVFNSLAVAIELPNAEIEVEAATDKTRFPPPPKTTRDRVNDVFGYDPSTKDSLITRTMKQAIFMMNGQQLHQQIDASPGSETMLARLLQDEPDDEAAIDVLYARVLARRATEVERRIVLRHIESVGDRSEAFEDVLWSLINSAEFTTRN